MVTAPSGPDPQNEAGDAAGPHARAGNCPAGSVQNKIERNALASSGTKEDSPAGPMSQAMGQMPIWTGLPIWAEGPKVEAHFGPITSTVRRRMNERGLLQSLQSLLLVRACSLSFSWRARLPVHRLPASNLSCGLRHHVDVWFAGLPPSARVRLVGLNAPFSPEAPDAPRVVRLEVSILLAMAQRIESAPSLRQMRGEAAPGKGRHLAVRLTFPWEGEDAFSIGAGFWLGAPGSADA